MDLTRLYSFTTPELRQEAERLGIRDAYAMSRGQLVQAIQEHLEPPTARKQGLFGKVVGFAKWAIQAAGETGAGTGTGTGDRGTEAVAVQNAPETEGTETEGTETEGTEVITVAESSVDADHGPPDPEPEPGPDPEPEPDLNPDRETVAVSSSRPPAGVFANNGGLLDEPIPTRTMARILAEQGHFKRSLAIYSKLLDEEPEDGELAREVESVREEAKARRSYAPQ